MRLIRQLEAEIMRLKERILEVRSLRDAQRKRADKLQQRLDRLEVLAPAAKKASDEFEHLRMRFKGREIKRGKIKLRAIP